ncbi:MAG: hypothetical protein ACK58M_25895, partial [Acidobacteriota bacterium]
GIQMILGAGFVRAVTASALPPLRPGVDQPDCVVVSAEYPEGFLATFTVNYAAMKRTGRAGPAPTGEERAPPAGPKRVRCARFRKSTRAATTS